MSIKAIEQAEKMVDEPTKIFGPDLENILNRAGFYKKREWVGLTAEDLQEFAGAQHHGWEWLCVAVEAKLKEKNCPSAD